jgi:hypothetical protein
MIDPSAPWKAFESGEKGRIRAHTVCPTFSMCDVKLIARISRRVLFYSKMMSVD